MENLILRYSRGRLMRNMLIGLALTGMAAWVLVGEREPEAGGRRSMVVEHIGPAGMYVLMWFFLGLCLIFVAVNARQFFAGDRVAARATNDGVKVRAIFGSHEHRWSEIAPIAIRHIGVGIRKQTIVQFRTLKSDGAPASGMFRRNFGLSGNTLSESAAEIEAWVDQANAMREVAIDKSR